MCCGGIVYLFVVVGCEVLLCFGVLGMVGVDWMGEVWYEE